jgi:hypothetical protein
MSAMSYDLIGNTQMRSEFDIPTAIDGEQDYVRDGDVILIVTGNHSYRFIVTDCETRRGLLTGGSLGERRFDAITNSSFQQGYGLSFKVELSGSGYRMETSDVIELVCIRDGESTRREMIKFPSFVSDMETARHEI